MIACLFPSYPPISLAPLCLFKYWRATVVMSVWGTRVHSLARNAMRHWGEETESASSGICFVLVLLPKFIFGKRLAINV